MVVVNSFAEHLIEGNLPNLKNWAQCKCRPVIQFHKLYEVIGEGIGEDGAAWCNIEVPPSKKLPKF